MRRRTGGDAEGVAQGRVVGQGSARWRRVEVAERRCDHDGGGGVGRWEQYRAAPSGQGPHPGVEVVEGRRVARIGRARAQSGYCGDGVAGAPQFHEPGGGGPHVTAPGGAGGRRIAERARPGGRDGGQGVTAVGERAGQDAVPLGGKRAPVLGRLGVDEGVPVGDPVGDLAAVAGAVWGVVGQALPEAEFGMDLAGDGVGAGERGPREVPVLVGGSAPRLQGAADRGQ